MNLFSTKTTLERLCALSTKFPNYCFQLLFDFIRIFNSIDYLRQYHLEISWINFVFILAFSKKQLLIKITKLAKK